MQWKFIELRETVATKSFWKDLAANMKGTEVVACGLRFPRFEYVSYLKPFSKLEVGTKRRWFKRNGLKLFLGTFLVWYAVKLWSPPAGDAPEAEPAKPEPVVAEHKTQETGSSAEPDTKWSGGGSTRRRSWWWRVVCRQGRWWR